MSEQVHDTTLNVETAPVETNEVLEVLAAEKVLEVEVVHTNGTNHVEEVHVAQEETKVVEVEKTIEVEQREETPVVEQIQALEESPVAPTVQTPQKVKTPAKKSEKKSAPKKEKTSTAKKSATKDTNKSTAKKPKKTEEEQVAKEPKSRGRTKTPKAAEVVPAIATQQSSRSRSRTVEKDDYEKYANMLNKKTSRAKKPTTTVNTFPTETTQNN